MADATDFRIRRRDEADYAGGPVPPGMKAVVAQEVFHGQRPEPRAIDVIPEMVQQGVTPSHLEREIVDDAIVRSRVGGTVGIPVASAVVTMMADAADDFPHLRNIDHRSPAPNPLLLPNRSPPPAADVSSSRDPSVRRNLSTAVSNIPCIPSRAGRGRTERPGEEHHM